MHREFSQVQPAHANDARMSVTIGTPAAFRCEATRLAHGT
jgi:hypothetical protein